MTHECSTKLVLLPGLGADARLFRPQRRAFRNLQVLDWLAAERFETLRHYAARVAARIDASGPLYLGGVSFGGMVALEMAALLKPMAAFLIASCPTGRCIPLRYRALWRVSRLFPVNPFRLRGPLTRRVLRKLGARTPAHRQLVSEMLMDASPGFLRWAVSAMMAWRPAGEMTVPVFHIHGDDDRMIPVRAVRPDRIVKGGGHLINLTHPDDVNSFIREVMRADQEGCHEADAP